MKKVLLGLMIASLASFADDLQIAKETLKNQLAKEKTPENLLYIPIMKKQVECLEKTGKWSCVQTYIDESAVIATKLLAEEKARKVKKADDEKEKDVEKQRATYLSGIRNVKPSYVEHYQKDNKKYIKEMIDDFDVYEKCIKESTTYHNMKYVCEYNFHGALNVYRERNNANEALLSAKIKTKESESKYTIDLLNAAYEYVECANNIKEKNPDIYYFCGTKYRKKDDEYWNATKQQMLQEMRKE